MAGDNEQTPGPQLAGTTLSIQLVHLELAHVPKQTFGGLLEKRSKYKQMSFSQEGKCCPDTHTTLHK